MCTLRIKGRLFNASIFNLHSHHLGSDDCDKNAFYAQLEGEYDSCSSHDVKIVIGNVIPQVAQEKEFRLVIVKFSAYQHINDNGLRLTDFK